MEVNADVLLHLGATSEATNDKLDAMLGKFPAHPFQLTRVRTALADGTNPVVVDLGNPPSSSLWSVGLVTVMGTDPVTIIADSNCVLYVGDPYNYSNADVIVPSNANTVPNTVSFSRNTVWVHSEERLFVVAYGIATPKQSITAIAKVAQWQAKDIEPSRSQ